MVKKQVDRTKALKRRRGNKDKRLNRDSSKKDKLRNSYSKAKHKTSKKGSSKKGSSKKGRSRRRNNRFDKGAGLYGFNIRKMFNMSPRRRRTRWLDEAGRSSYDDEPGSFMEMERERIADIKNKMERERIANKKNKKNKKVRRYNQVDISKFKFKDYNDYLIAINRLKDKLEAEYQISLSDYNKRSQENYDRLSEEQGGDYPLGYTGLTENEPTRRDIDRDILTEDEFELLEDRFKKLPQYFKSLEMHGGNPPTIRRIQKPRRRTHKLRSISEPIDLHSILQQEVEEEIEKIEREESLNRRRRTQRRRSRKKGPRPPPRIMRNKNDVIEILRGMTNISKDKLRVFFESMGL